MLNEHGDSKLANIHAKIIESFAKTFPNWTIVSATKRYDWGTVITRKQWNRKTTLYQYLSVFDRVTKQIVLPDTSKITFLWNGSVYTAQLMCFMVTELLKVKTRSLKPSYYYWIFS